MQAEDGLDEAGDSGGAAAELAQEAPGLEGGDGLLDEGSDLRVGPVDRLLAWGKRLPPAPVWDTDCASGAPESTMEIVNPVWTHVIPYDRVRWVGLEDTGTLIVSTAEVGDIASTGFGGSVIDHFVGSSGRAVEKVESAVKSGRAMKGGAATFARRCTRGWVSDISAAFTVMCGLLMLFA